MPYHFYAQTSRMETHHRNWEQNYYRLDKFQVEQPDHLQYCLFQKYM